MNRARWKVQYDQYVLSTNPIAYWIQDEKQGNVAYDRVSGRVAGAQNGTITGATLGQPGIGDGRTSFSYDGANDYTNAWSAVLAGIFNGDEGSVMLWGRTTAWADGALRYALLFGPGASTDYIYISKPAGVNALDAGRRAQNVSKNVVFSSSGTLDWFSVILTWSLSLDEVRVYFNGFQVGATQNGLLAMVGALANGTTTIGAVNTAPALVWNGLINHVPIWNRALPPTIVESLYQESF